MDGEAFSARLALASIKTLYKVLAYLVTQKKDYDIFDLRWIDNRLGLGDVIAVAMREQGFQVRRAVWHETSQIDLTCGWEAYWASRTPHWRTNVRSNIKKLNQAGRVEFIRYRPDASAKSGRSNENQVDPRWDLYYACEELAAKSWQGERTDGTTLSHLQVRDYLRAAHESATRCGAADINLLLVDQKPIAFAYNYASLGRSLDCEPAMIRHGSNSA